jgi:hypothetical protein
MGFKVGDLVSRDGTDRHRVINTNEASAGWPPDLIEVVCEKAPETGWCRVGDVETNLARRYEMAPPAEQGEKT